MLLSSRARIGTDGEKGDEVDIVINVGQAEKVRRRAGGGWPASCPGKLVLRRGAGPFTVCVYSRNPVGSADPVVIIKVREIGKMPAARWGILAVLAFLPGMRPAAAAVNDGLVLDLDAETLWQEGPVAEWKDTSGKDNDVRQGDVGAQPHFHTDYANGHPAVVFDGKEFLDGPAVLAEGAKELTYVAVWERRATGGPQSIVEQAGPGQGRRAALLTLDAGYGFNGELNDIYYMLPFQPGNFAVSVLRLQPNGVVTLFHNGYVKSGYIDMGRENIGVDKLRVGAKVFNGPERLDGAVQEVRVYNRALSDAEAQDVTAELMKKWGVTAEAINPDLAAAVKEIQDNSANPARYTEPYRPQYHFTPITGQVNDPNGLVYFNGQWHLFYQSNGWGHAVSEDLLHWQHLAPAISSDDLGVAWSGSAVVDWHDASGFFGGKPGIVCFYTYMNPAEQGRQSIALAYSADGVNFTKYPKNPVIPQLRYQPGQPDDHDFRDPKVIWYEPAKRWIMVVAGGTVRFYSSANLRDWTFESINQDIQTECPDFFPMPVEGKPGDVKWVLSGAGRWYRVGSFDGHKFTPETDAIPLNFGRDFYAAQTWSDVPDGRRIMIARLYTWDYGNGWPPTAWAGGGMTLPYELKLRQTDAGPRIFSTPVKEVEALRGKELSSGEQTIATGSKPLNGARGEALEIDAEFDVSGTATSFGFKVPKGGGEQTAIGYSVTDESLFVDRRNAGFAKVAHYNEIYEALMPPQNQRVKLRVFIDAESVEVFGNDGAAVITANILPDPQREGLEIFATGGEAKLVSLEIYMLKNVWREEKEE
jgi:fructan beta-fructosidase